MIGIKNRNFRRFRTQGTVGAGVFIHTFTTSFPPAVLPSMVPDGSTRRPDSSCRFKHSARPSVASSVRNYGNFSNRTDSSSITRFSTLPHLEHQLFPLATGPKRLGRICQATLWRCRTCPQLPRTLHPPRCHLQPSARGLRERSRVIPLARLCAWRQAKGHDSYGGSVPPQIFSSRAAQRPGPHPPLRLVSQPQKGNRPCTLSRVAWRDNQRRALGNDESTALPACSATMLVIERFTSAQLYFEPHLCLATPQS
jgi:hypothetical protein